MAGEAVNPAVRANVEVLDVRVDCLEQLFNAIDPAPFRGRALDPDAEAYLVGRTLELPRRRSLELRVYLNVQPVTAQGSVGLREAVRIHFDGRAASQRRQIRRLLRIGRISLLIGVVFLAVAVLAENTVAEVFGLHGYNRVLTESLFIGGWVALWRPLEICLYDWWPLLAEARLYDRMGAMRVELLEAPPTPETRESVSN